MNDAPRAEKRLYVLVRYLAGGGKESQVFYTMTDQEAEAYNQRLCLDGITTRWEVMTDHRESLRNKVRKQRP